MTVAATRVLGRLLVGGGVVGEAEVAAALAEQRRTGERLGEVLVRRGLDPEHVARALAEQLRLPYAPPPLQPTPDALRLVDGALACRLRVVPLAVREQALRVALADPLEVAAVDDLRFQTGRRIEPAVALPEAVDAALAEAYGAEAMATVLGRLPAVLSRPAASPAEEAAEVGALRRASEAPPIIALVNLILARAHAGRASDVHIEPAGRRMRVRARVDGVLRELIELPEGAGGAVVSRIKIMAGLDIAVKRRPQDGRGAVLVDGRELGLRVSSLPAAGGEKVVLRLLDAGNADKALDDLGLSPGVLARFRRLLERGHGVVLVTGPTGSGKTTTLYAALASLDRERRNIVTLEDPIEYRLPGLTQVQVHHRAGLGFVAALRSVLRQDPDVIMVGEMRDRRTVEVGMAAALTGHLVLSTLHTNDAPGAVARLLEMEAPPYLIAGGLIGVLAQRLVRCLCTHCREARRVEGEELRALGLPGAPVTLWEPRGCGRCDGTGYHGRTGVTELLVVDARIRALVLRRASADAIREAARGAGMTTLGEDAWAKLREGITTLDEVRPLLTTLLDEAPTCPVCGAGVRADFLLCPGCGERLRHRCACGAVLEAPWRRCPACGRAREDAAPQATSAPRSSEMCAEPSKPSTTGRSST